jgi:hypothetical protein
VVEEVEEGEEEGHCLHWMSAEEQKKGWSRSMKESRATRKRKAKPKQDLGTRDI